MMCLRPIVVRVPIGPWFCPQCSDHPPPAVKSIEFSVYVLCVCMKCLRVLI
ncbi:putative histone-lysine N-methyltransferase [Helianthus annuus]|uniref:Histone-lysine N-methyltransferase n=1 Tax=Helianthus annuus TaxID=4232 RepID=A0A9K3HU69_HELAN|nr:putative histone-lysine N-methyltransferase [Helianthus annuus]KAJ0877466.1 putative histone-lysine N-methyltransferase [Helianthus annuus]